MSTWSFLSATYLLAFSLGLDSCLDSGLDSCLPSCLPSSFLPHAARHAVVLLTDDVRRQKTREGIERIDRRIDAAFDDGARQAYGCAQVSEGGGDRRVGIVVGRDEDRLDRGDRPLLGRRDALL